MVAASRTPQQARARLTRQALLDAAATEFSHRGYAAASVNTILADSGHTKGALYFHFPSKHAIAEAVADAATDRYVEIAGPWRESDLHPVEALSGLVGAVTAAVAAEPVLLAELRLGYDPDFTSGASGRASRGWETVALELAADLDQSGCIVSPFDPGRLVAAMASMLAGGRLMADLSGDPIMLQTRLDETIDVVITAMTTTETTARFVASRAEAR